MRRDSIFGVDLHIPTLVPTFDLTEYLAAKERAALEALHLRRPDYKQVKVATTPSEGDAHDEETPRTPRESLTSEFEGEQVEVCGEEGGSAIQEEHEFVPVLSLPSPDTDI